MENQLNPEEKETFITAKDNTSPIHTYDVTTTIAENKGTTIHATCIKQTNHWKDLCVVVTILDGLLAVFGVAIVVVWRCEVGNLSSEQTNEFCLPCDKVKVHVNDDWINRRHFTVKHESQTEICCTTSDKDLDQLVELFVDRHYRHNRAEEPLINTCIGKVYKKTETPTARVTGIAGTIKDKDTYVLNYDRVSANSFVHSQLLYSEGRFTIQKDAYYYVYSQVTFNDVLLDDHDNRYVQHYIYRLRKNSSTKRALIASTDVLCSPEGDRTNSTSHIGTVTYLNVGDEIGVKMREPHRLAGNPYSNYFGIHAI